MDPVSLIVAALAAGAVAGAQNTATAMFKDAYDGLRNLAATRLRGTPAGEVALQQYKLEPERGRGALRAELEAVSAGQDAVLVEAASRVMDLVDPVGSRAGKYRVDLRSAQGVQVGDGNSQTNTF